MTSERMDAMVETAENRDFLDELRYRLDNGGVVWSNERDRLNAHDAAVAHAAREAMKYLAEMYYKRVLMGFDSDYQHDEIANMLNTTAAEAVMEARKANTLAAAAVKNYAPLPANESEMPVDPAPDQTL